MLAYLNEKLKEQIDDCLFHRDTTEAKALAEDLRRALVSVDDDPKVPDDEKYYWHNQLCLLQLQSLALFSDEQVAEFFRKNLLGMLSSEDINIYERFKSKQMSVPYELMEDFLILMIEAIHQNEQWIGQNMIFIPGEAEAVEPTVKNWLSDYDRTYGTEAQKDIVWLDYAAQSRNASVLNADERSLLRSMLKFYEFLKPEFIDEE